MMKDYTYSSLSSSQAIFKIKVTHAYNLCSTSVKARTKRRASIRGFRMTLLNYEPLRMV